MIAASSNTNLNSSGIRKRRTGELSRRNNNSGRVFRTHPCQNYLSQNEALRSHIKKPGIGIRTLALFVNENIERQQSGNTDIGRIHQLRNSNINRHAGNHKGLLAGVTIGRGDIVNNTIDGITCREIDIV